MASMALNRPPWASFGLLQASKASDNRPPVGFQRAFMRLHRPPIGRHRSPIEDSQPRCLKMFEVILLLNHILIAFWGFPCRNFDLFLTIVLPQKDVFLSHLRVGRWSQIGLQITLSNSSSNSIVVVVIVVVVVVVVVVGHCVN